MKKEMLKGLSLALAVAIAMFMFLFGCSNQPLAIILVAAIPAAYIAFVAYVECLVEDEDYGYVWFLVAYLFITGLIMFLSQMALIILFVMVVTTLIIFLMLYDFSHNDYGIEVVTTLAPIAQMVVVLFVTMCTDFSYEDVKNRYEDNKELLLNHRVVSEEEIENVNNIYDLEELYLTQKHKADAVNEKLDSIKHTIKVRDYDSVEIPEAKQLYIKRLWYNSDQTPWSYEAYGNFKFNVTSVHGLFSGRTSINADINYSGEYEGEHNIEYVNIVLSDNTFYRFKVADKYQWLVAKEGDKVTKTFTKNKLDFEKLHQPVIKSELKLNF